MSKTSTYLAVIPETKRGTSALHPAPARHDGRIDVERLDHNSTESSQLRSPSFRRFRVRKVATTVYCHREASPTSSTHRRLAKPLMVSIEQTSASNKQTPIIPNKRVANHVAQCSLENYDRATKKQRCAEKLRSVSLQDGRCGGFKARLAPYSSPTLIDR